MENDSGARLGFPLAREQPASTCSIHSRAQQLPLSLAHDLGAASPSWPLSAIPETVQHAGQEVLGSLGMQAPQDGPTFRSPTHQRSLESSRWPEGLNSHLGLGVGE